MSKTKPRDIVESHIGSEPLGIIVLTEGESRQIADSRFGFEQFSITRPHSEVAEFRKFHICLIYPTRAGDHKEAHIAAIKSKQAVATTSSRINLIHGRQVTKCLPKDIRTHILNKTLRARFDQICSIKGIATKLSKKLGEYVYRGIASRNRNSLASIIDSISGHGRRSTGWRLQASVLYDAISIFGLGKDDLPEVSFSNEDDSSSIELLRGPQYLLEDQVIAHDARDMPGWRLIASDMTGMAQFRKGRTSERIYRKPNPG